MIPIFNAENDFLEQKQLKSAFETDPNGVCDKIEAVLEQCSVAARATDAEVQYQEKKRLVLSSIATSAEAFERSVPQRSSMFRGGEDSVRTYRALVPFLLRLEGDRGTLRTQARTLSQWRDALLELRAVMERLMASVATLHFFSDSQNREMPALETLKTRVQTESERQKQILKKIEETLTENVRIDRDVIGAFLVCVFDASDSEHDGEKCHCTKVLTLIGELKKEIKLI